MEPKKSTIFLNLCQELIRLPLTFANGGFTLIEILVVVLIIGILGAIMLPQYQRAVLKSRFAALMPIAKSMADSNEAYYLEYGEYADNAEDLPVQGRRNYSDGTELEFGTSTKYAYVLATNSSVENNKYIVYQKHSENFPGNTHCEALTGDDKAEELCQALGGAYIGENGDFTAYLLSGNSTRGTFEKECTAEPETEKSCECGQETREAACNTKTGQWNYGEWSGCPDKPDTSQACSKNGKNGTQTRSVTCGENGWEPGNWGACDIPCTDPNPGDIASTHRTGAQGTATCVEGEYVYTWTGGGTEYSDARRNGICYSGKCSCEGSLSYGCATAIFSGENTYCFANGRYDSHGCSYTTYTGKNSYCNGFQSYACSNSVFSGEGSACGVNSSMGNYGCANSVFSGNKSYCNGSYNTSVVSVCAGSVFQAGAYCKANGPGQCDDTTYVAHPDKDSSLTGCCTGDYCPAGSPKCKTTSNGDLVWNSENQAYDVDGTW